MKVSEVLRAKRLIDLGNFMKAAQGSSHYLDGVMTIKSRSNGSPEHSLNDEEKRIVVDTVLAYCEDELDKLGVVPDPVEEAPEESA